MLSGDLKYLLKNKFILVHFYLMFILELIWNLFIQFRFEVKIQPSSVNIILIMWD